MKRFRLVLAILLAILAITVTANMVSAEVYYYYSANYAPAYYYTPVAYYTYTPAYYSWGWWPWCWW